VLLLSSLNANSAITKKQAYLPAIYSILLDECNPSQATIREAIETGSAIIATSGRAISGVVTIDADTPDALFAILMAPSNSLIVRWLSRCDLRAKQYHCHKR